MGLASLSACSDRRLRRILKTSNDWCFTGKELDEVSSCRGNHGSRYLCDTLRCSSSPVGVSILHSLSPVPSFFNGSEQPTCLRLFECRECNAVDQCAYHV